MDELGSTSHVSDFENIVTEEYFVFKTWWIHREDIIQLCIISEVKCFDIQCNK